MRSALNADKRRYDDKAKSCLLPVGSRVLLQRCAFEGRHKLSDNFYEESFVVISHNENVYSIRPAMGGPVRTVNRKLLILDPRQVEAELPDFYMEDDNSDTELGKVASSDESDIELEQGPYYVRVLPLPAPPRFEEEPGNVEQDRVVVLVGPRRSTRQNKGVHTNPQHLPRSVFDSEGPDS